MSKQKKGFILCLIAAAVMLAASMLFPAAPKGETVQEAMRDAVPVDCQLVNVSDFMCGSPGVIFGTHHLVV